MEESSLILRHGKRDGIFDGSTNRRNSSLNDKIIAFDTFEVAMGVDNKLY